MADRPLRVLHVVHPSFVGGLERVVLAMASGHHARGVDVRVLAIVPEGNASPPFVEMLRARGVPVIPLPLPGRAYLRERREIRRVCESFRPHVLHTHGDRGDVLASPIGRALGIGTVVTDHGTSMMAGMGRVYEWLQRRTFRRFDAVVVVSRKLDARARRDRVRPERIHFVPNAWHSLGAAKPRDVARRELGLPADVPVVGWVARMIPVKDPLLFVDAAARVAPQDARFVMIGDGPEREKVQAAAARLGLADRLVLPGAIAHAAPLMTAFDCWVISSISEGTPIALFEAIDAGVPVVATEVGEVPVVLGPGAPTCAVGDAAGLARGIEQVLRDLPTARAEAARRKARVAETYAMDPWLQRYEEIYAQFARDAR